MQTFLPYKSFLTSVACLDYRRLGKQRVEAMQLVNTTEKLERGEPAKGWVNHPARLMWVGYLDALKHYHNVCITEWVLRGYKNTMQYYDVPAPHEIEMPPWLGDDRLHRSHKSNLVRKDPAFYGPIFLGVPADIEYWWPVQLRENA